MYLPKADIFNWLSTLGYTVLQEYDNEFNTLPVLTFYAADNSVNLDLDNEITHQEISIVIDIWADDSTTASRILSETEALLRSKKYRLEFSADVPNPDESLHHINTRFSTII